MAKNKETITIGMELYKQLQSRKSAYKRFGQLNLDQIKALDYILRVKDGSSALRIFLFLVDHMDNYNAIVCSSKVISEALDMSSATVSRAIKVLKDNEIIGIGKSGTTNIYYINKEIIWHSWATNRRYAKFGANVVISESEQTETTKYSQITIKDFDSANITDYYKNDEDDLDDDDYFDDDDIVAEEE